MSVGKRIAERRAELNISQTELAKRAGCSQSALSDLENGKTEGTSFLARFALHLSVHALWLETGEEPRLLSETAALVTSLPPLYKEILSYLPCLTARQILELKASLEKMKESNIELLRELLPLEKALGSTLTRAPEQ